MQSIDLSIEGKIIFAKIHSYYILSLLEFEAPGCKTFTVSFSVTKTTNGPECICLPEQHHRNFAGVYHFCGGGTDDEVADT